MNKKHDALAGLPAHQRGTHTELQEHAFPKLHRVQTDTVATQTDEQTFKPVAGGLYL